MKNIYQFQTERETSIHFDTKYFRTLLPQVSNTINSAVSGYNIFIISDDELKPNDWFIDTKRNLISQVDKLEIATSKKVMCAVSSGGYYILEDCKKIVLTTDKYLIIEGVQPIKIDFIKWYIDKANDSGVPIDYVKIKKGFNFCPGICGICDGTCDPSNFYEIIIEDQKPVRTDKLTLTLDTIEARHLLNCLLRTSAKGKDLDVGEMIEDKLVKFLK